MDVLHRNHVTQRGTDGPVLLFAHGFGCSQTVWSEVACAFESSHREFLFDYVGSGNASAAAFDEVRYSTLSGYVQDLLEVCDALHLQSDVTLVAHSVSCTIGMLAALERPGLFGRMILLGPSPCFINHPPEYIGGFERADLTDLLTLMEENYVGWAEYLAPVAACEAGPVAADLTTRFCSTDPVAAKAFARATFFSDQRTILSRIHTPCLILQNRDDVMAPQAVGEYLHQRLQGSTLQVLDARGHCAHLSCPDLVIAAMRAYLFLTPAADPHRGVAG